MSLTFRNLHKIGRKNLVIRRYVILKTGPYADKEVLVVGWKRKKVLIKLEKEDINHSPILIDYHTEFEWTDWIEMHGGKCKFLVG